MRPSRRSFERFLGTKAYAASAGLFEAISAGLVVADENGRWTENPKKRVIALYPIGAAIGARRNDHDSALARELGMRKAS